MNIYTSFITIALSFIPLSYKERGIHGPGEQNSMPPSRKFKKNKTQNWSNRSKPLESHTWVTISIRFGYPRRHEIGVIENSALWVLIPTEERGREQKYLLRTATSGSSHSAPAGGATYQGTAGYIKNLSSHQGLGQHAPPAWLCHGRLPHRLSGRPVCSRGMLSNSTLSLEMQQLLSPLEYVEPPKATALIPVPIPSACKEGVE